MSRLFTFRMQVHNGSLFVVNIFRSTARAQPVMAVVIVVVVVVVVPGKYQERCALRGSHYTLPYFADSGIVPKRRRVTQHGDSRVS